MRPEHTRGGRPVAELQLTAIIDYEQIELQNAITSSLHVDAGGTPSPVGPECEELGDPQDVEKYLVGANKRPVAPPEAVRSTTMFRSYGERADIGYWTELFGITGYTQGLFNPNLWEAAYNAIQLDHNKMGFGQWRDIIPRSTHITIMDVSKCYAYVSVCWRTTIHELRENWFLLMTGYETGASGSGDRIPIIFS